VRDLALAFLVAASLAACSEARSDTTGWEAENPVASLPEAPLGVADHVNWGKLEALQGLKVTPEKVRLGRWLFFDPRLSSDGTVSCATCHRPGHAFSEPLPTSKGMRGQVGARKAPPIVNAAFPIEPVYFWDGRASTLAEQAKGPIENPIEMGNTHVFCAQTVGRIAGYRRVFREVYGSEEPTIDRIADAIAAYEATLFSGNSAWDRYQADDEATIAPEVKLGANLFHGKAQCNQCHLGFNFTDSKFHNLGVGWDAAANAYKDEGRKKVTGKPEDLGAFKTPTLRDVTRHAPYMHDGSVATLKEVVELYDRGGVPGAPNLSPKVRKLGLTKEEVAAIVAFLEALAGDNDYANTAPASLPD
jgi:cytochrome c peroxidase